MPNTREKLIELLKDTHANAAWHHWGYEESAGHLIANGVTLDNQIASSSKQLASNEWISVKDRLPEEDGKYLVFEQNSGRTNTSILWFAKDARKVDRYDFKGRWKNAWYEYDSEWGHYTVNSVTHWMPLPQPPKGE